MEERGNYKDMKQLKNRYVIVPVLIFFLTLIVSSIKFQIQTPIIIKQLDSRVKVTEEQCKLLPEMSTDIKWIKKILEERNKEKS